MTHPDDAGDIEGSPTGHRAAHAFGATDPVETIEGLEQLSAREGRQGVRVAAELIEDELHAKSPARRFGEIGVASLITILIFVRVIPRFFGVEYRSVWTLLSGVSPLTIGTLFALWFFTMWAYAGFLAASLPGLRRLQAIVVNFSGSALANVVPFGGAAGVGGTYAQCLSWGLEAPAITLSIVISGVWNVFAKLGMPVIVLALLVGIGHNARGLGAAALIGFAVLVAAVTVFALTIRSERLATTIGRALDRVVTRSWRLVRRTPPADLAGKVLGFRHQSAELIGSRWRRLTGWMIIYKLSQGLLQVMCARAVGVDVGVIELLAVYAFGELLTTIPLTPSGVGFVEVGAAGLLVSFGASNESALAAVLLYRAFTYLFEIPLGAVGWLTWATKHSWRRPRATPPSDAAIPPVIS